MTIGIHNFHEPKQITWLPGMLLLPFKENIYGYTINRRQWDADDQK